MSENNGVEAEEGSEEGDMVETIESLFCDICQKYYDKKYYKTHVETHREDVKVKCTVCNNEYRNKHSLDTHMQKKHKNGQILETKTRKKPGKFADDFVMMNTDINRKCTMCRRTFGSKSTKNRHMNQTHASMDKMDCICEEQFDELFMETFVEMINESLSDFGSSAGASNNNSDENGNDVNQDSNEIIKFDASQQTEYDTLNNSDNSNDYSQQTEYDTLNSSGNSNDNSQPPNTDIMNNDESTNNTNMTTLGHYLEFAEENSERSVEYIEVTENQYKWFDVENKLHSASNDLADLHNNHQNLQNEFSKISGVFQTISNSNFTLQNDLQSLSEERAEANAQNAQLQTEVEKWSTECENYKKKNVKLQDEIIGLSKERDDLKTKNSDLEIELDDLSNERDDIETENEQLKNNLKSLSEEHDEINAQNAQHQTEVKNWSTECENYKKKYAKLQDKIIGLSKERDYLKTKNSDLESALDDLSNERDHIETENEELQNNLKSLSEERDKINAQNAQLQTEVKKWSTECENYKEKNAELQDKIIGLSKERDDLKTKNSDLEFELDDLLNERDDIETENEELQNNLKSLSEERDEINAQNALHQTEVKNWSTECENYKKKSAELQDIIIGLSKERDDLKTKNSDLEIVCNDVNAKYSKLQIEVDKWSSQCYEYETKYAELQTEIVCLSTERDGLKTKNVELECGLGELLLMSTTHTRLADANELKLREDEKMKLDVAIRVNNPNAGDASSELTSMENEKIQGNNATIDEDASSTPSSSGDNSEHELPKDEQIGLNETESDDNPSSIKPNPGDASSELVLMENEPTKFDNNAMIDEDPSSTPSDLSDFSSEHEFSEDMKIELNVVNSDNNPNSTQLNSSDSFTKLVSSENKQIKSNNARIDEDASSTPSSSGDNSEHELPKDKQIGLNETESDNNPSSIKPNSGDASSELVLMENKPTKFDNNAMIDEDTSSTPSDVSDFSSEHELMDVEYYDGIEKLPLDTDDEYMEEPPNKRQKLTDSELLKLSNNVIVDENLSECLLAHQVEGIKFMWKACFESFNEGNKNIGGCILAHSMGLGKTVQVIVLVHTLITHLQETAVKRVLILCPLSVVANWNTEFQLWLTKCDCDKRIPVSAIYGNDVWKIMKWTNDGGVLITNYENFQRLAKSSAIDRENFIDPGADLVVLDEGHLLKNEATTINELVSSIKTLRRIILSGTPMQNNLKEYYCMMQLIRPGLVGDYKSFVNDFEKTIKNGQYKDSSTSQCFQMEMMSAVLHKTFKKYIHRMDESYLLQLIPKKYEFVLNMNLSRSQRMFYNTYIESKGSTNVVPLLAGVRKITVHPLALNYTSNMRQKHDRHDLQRKTRSDENWWRSSYTQDIAESLQHSPKLLFLFKMLEECYMREEKVVVFSECLSTFYAIEHFLAKVDEHTRRLSKFEGFFGEWTKDFDYFVLTGRTKVALRKKFLEKFNDPNHKSRLFLVSTHAGGIGINLTGANRIIIFDSCWNPAMDAQAVSRCYRIGQGKECFVYRLISYATIEESIYKRQIVKGSTAKRVVDNAKMKSFYAQEELKFQFLLGNAQSLRPSNFFEKKKEMFESDSLLSEIMCSTILRNCIIDANRHDTLLESQGQNDDVELLK